MKGGKVTYDDLMMLACSQCSGGTDKKTELIKIYNILVVASEKMKYFSRQCRE